MTHTSIRLLGAVALTSIGVPPAIADSGWYVHGGLNSTTLEQSTDRNTGTDGPTVGPAGGPSLSTVAQDTGTSVYVAGGYQFQPFADGFVAIEAFYADETAETQNLNNVKITDIELNSSYGIDLKLGQSVTDKLTLYGLVGVTQYDFDGQISYTFAPPIDDISSEEAAFVYGGGLELAFSDRWSTVTEVRIANDVEFSTPVDRGGIQSDDQFDYFVLRSGLKYKF
ncbi:MAG: outer membrane beta-barrel protein [Pseudomonadota bacterium]